MILESYSGSVFTNIVGIDFYNAYQNITAVGLRVYEPGTEGIPGVLIGAHFDSTIGTPGEIGSAQIHDASCPWCQRSTATLKDSCQIS